MVFPELTAPIPPERGRNLSLGDGENPRVDAATIAPRPSSRARLLQLGEGCAKGARRILSGGQRQRVAAGSGLAAAPARCPAR